MKTGIVLMFLFGALLLISLIQRDGLMDTVAWFAAAVIVGIGAAVVAALINRRRGF